MPPNRAWAVPAVVAVGILAATLAPRAFAADPHPPLPHRTATQLIAAVERSNATGISGDYRTVADLGLPKLPNGGSEFENVATGTALWHVWDSGQTRQRVALLGRGDEYDAVDDDGLFWTWNSMTQTATRVIVRLQPASTRGNAGGPPFAPPSRNNPGASSPPSLARRLLHALKPTTDLTVGATQRVAGRPAYSLDLAPRTSGTLVGRVTIAVDSITGVPLQVQIFPRGSGAAAFTAGFTSVTFGRVDPAVFRFRPPPGAKLRITHLSPQFGGSNSDSRLIGSGWTAVVESAGKPMRFSGLALDATRAVPGGRLLSTRLFTAFVGADGRTLAGAVPGSRLLQLAAHRPSRPAR